MQPIALYQKKVSLPQYLHLLCLVNLENLVYLEILDNLGFLEKS